LYALLSALPITGWLLSPAERDAVRYFALFGLPPVHFAAGEGSLEEVHEVLYSSLFASALLQVAGALKDHFWNRDHTLRRDGHSAFKALRRRHPCRTSSPFRDWPLSPANG
jgi:cytochrome b561